MKQDYARLFRKSEYTFLYLANSTNKQIQIFKRLALGIESTIWLGKEQPFAPIAPPVIGGTND